ncbi:pyridoxal phosphate-dependent aminotransferase [Candidatus Micrarchaeota archaeon]|nr:pyridoxal phosphate-dependent aminotransferase [Candidatus Micrarchaeota archaeon]
MNLAFRTKNLSTEGSFQFSSKVKQFELETKKKVVKLHIGEPDFPTPDNVKQAGIQAIKDGKTGYTVPEGILELRQAVCDCYSSYSPEQVLIGPGGKTLINNVLSVFAEEGKEVIVPNPSYPAYEVSAKFFGAKPVYYNSLTFDVEELKERVSKKTSLLVLNSPSNPTGRVVGREFLKTVKDLALDNDFFVLSDEIYSRIIYGKKFESITQFKEIEDKIILFDGFSKTYSMTGWRLAWVVCNPELASLLKVVGINSYSCPANFVQWAGIEALKGQQDSVKKMVSEYEKRKEFVVKRLNEMPGVDCYNPEGAFYVFPNISKAIKNKPTAEFQNYLLEKFSVSVLAGTNFGSNGEGFIRISYASSMNELKQGLDGIEKALKSF